MPGTFSPSPPESPTISSQRSLAKAVYDRRAEFTKQKKLRIKIGSWNVAALPGTEQDVRGWFLQGKGVYERLAGLRVSGSDESSSEVEGVTDQERRQDPSEPTIPHHDPAPLPGGDEIDLYVLGLQEIVDINSPAEALKPYNDPHPAEKWKRAVEDGLPLGYKLVSEQQMFGLLLLIYAAPSIEPTITSVSSTSVGTGMLYYMGNKGAVSTRIVIGEITRLVFVNSHLAAGSEKGQLERRNWDSSQIVSRTKYTPLDDYFSEQDDPGSMIGDEDFAFWFGDLNYRLSGIPGDDVRRLLLLHTRDDYDIADTSLSKGQKKQVAQIGEQRTDNQDKNAQHPPPAKNQNRADGSDSPPLFDDELDPEDDPASLQTTLSSLLPHDQLREQMRLQKAFHEGWREGPIKFLPTYKYDVGRVGLFDTSEKKRSPSWCDRILFRTRRDYQNYKHKKEEDEDTKRRDEDMKARGLDNVSDEVLFDYNPDTDGVEDYEEDLPNEATKNRMAGDDVTEERIFLNYYTSHQRVLSSDHKPLEAVFLIKYDAVDPDLKATVHQEVARELDKMENEARPVITVIADNAGTSNNGEDIDFGEISYAKPARRSLTIANTGRVPAEVSFVETHNGQIAPSWLSITYQRDEGSDQSPRADMSRQKIEPGEVVHVDLILNVTLLEDVRQLNEEVKNLEDVLILRVQSGRDHFIALRGIWLRSCFGLPLETLIRIPEGGVRNFKFSGSIDDEEVKWSAPRELFRLTETLERFLERSVAEWGMTDSGPTKAPWSSIGWPFGGETISMEDEIFRETIRQSLRESLDTDSQFSFAGSLSPPEKVEILAGLLLEFLRGVPEGIINEELWKSLSKAIAERERSKKVFTIEDQRSQILDIISSKSARSVSFTFITFMLSRMINEIAPLNSDPTTPATPKSADALLGRMRGLSQDPATIRRKEIEKRYAEIFAGVLFKTSEPQGKEKRIADERKRTIIEVFLWSKAEGA